jgi:hypothetical protein
MIPFCQGRIYVRGYLGCSPGRGPGPVQPNRPSRPRLCLQPCRVGASRTRVQPPVEQLSSAEAETSSQRSSSVAPKRRRAGTAEAETSSLPPAASRVGASRTRVQPPAASARRVLASSRQPRRRVAYSRPAVSPLVEQLSNAEAETSRNCRSGDEQKHRSGAARRRARSQ